MRRREHYWSLFHRPAKNQLDDLNTNQVEAVFAAVPKSRHPEYLIWKDGLSEWKSFAEFPDLLISLRASREIHGAAPTPAAEDSTATRSNFGFKVPSEAPQPDAYSGTHPETISFVHHAKDGLIREAVIADGKVIILPGGASDTSVEAAARQPDQQSGSNRGQRAEKSLERPHKNNNDKPTEKAKPRKHHAAPDAAVPSQARPEVIISFAEETPAEDSQMSGVNLQTAHSIHFIPKNVDKIGDIKITDDTEDDLSNVFLTLESQGLPEDRGNGRYARRFAIRIVAGNVLLQTNTLDISANGIRIEQALPMGLPRYFNVELLTRDRVLPMVCSEVKLAGVPSTNRLKIEINEHPEVLQSLLIAG